MQIQAKIIYHLFLNPSMFLSGDKPILDNYLHTLTLSRQIEQVIQIYSFI